MIIPLFTPIRKTTTILAQRIHLQRGRWVISRAYYFSKYVGILGEFQGVWQLYAHGQHTAGCDCDSESNCVVTASGNLFTYNVGPIFKVRMHHFEPFAEALFGGAHSNFYGNLYKDCGPAGCIVGEQKPEQQRI